MTKKHFIALAAEIKNKFQLDRPSKDISRDTLNAAKAAADIICTVAMQDNPRFDRPRFLSACGLWTL